MFNRPPRDDLALKSKKRLNNLVHRGAPLYFGVVYIRVVNYDVIIDREINNAKAIL